MTRADEAEQLRELEAKAAAPGADLAKLDAVIAAVRRFYVAGATDDDRAQALIASYRALTVSAQAVLEQQLVGVEAVLQKVPPADPDRAGLVWVQRTFQRQCAGLTRLRAFFDSGDERLLDEAQTLLTVDEAGRPLAQPR